MPLKGILLVGKNIEITEDILDLYKKDGYLIIGDGVNLVTEDHIREQVAAHGGVDAGTRWDISAHGAVSDDNLKTSEKDIHECTFLKNSAKTSKILKLIKEISGTNPTEVHLWSCYGGSVARDANILPNGSFLACHSSENNVSSGFLSKIILHEQISKRQTREGKESHIAGKLNYRYILNDLSMGAAGKCIAKISGVKGSIKHYLEGNKKFLTTSDGIRRISREFVRRVYEASRSIKIRDRSIIFPNEKSVKDMSDDEISIFKTRRFYSELLINRPKFIKFLNEDKNRDYVVEQLTSKINGQPVLARISAIARALIIAKVYNLDAEHHRNIAIVSVVNNCFKSVTKPQMAELLPSTKPNKLLTSMMIIPETREGAKKILEYAKDQGDEYLNKICTPDKKNHTPISLVLDHQDIFDSLHGNLLENLGAARINRMLSDNNGQPEIFRIFSNHGGLTKELGESLDRLNALSYLAGSSPAEQLELKDNKGRNLLHHLLRSNRPEHVELLFSMIDHIDEPATREKILDEICKPDNKGRSPLLYVGEDFKHSNILIDNLRPERVRKMLEDSMPSIEADNPETAHRFRTHFTSLLREHELSPTSATEISSSPKVENMKDQMPNHPMSTPIAPKKSRLKAFFHIR